MGVVVNEFAAPSGRPAAKRIGPPTVIAGRYQVDLDAPLGAGGMALVYRGRDLRTRRDVALKTLRLEYRRDPETRARFRRETRTMAFITHPHVARVFDLVEEPEAPWAIMEYVPGRTLKELLSERGPLPPAAVADILDQTASALAHLHARRLVHLDVKPQNLLMTPDGVVKLIDFGLAQPAGGPPEAIGGTTFGTAAYLAPEQACGDSVDVATDVYALGCVVYELLTGQPPFPALDAGAGQAHGQVKHHVIRAHLEQQPAAPTQIRPDLPAWVDDVVLWALAKRPADRYGDVLSFARLFRDGVRGEPMSAIDPRDATTRPVTIVDVKATAAGAQPAPAPAAAPTAVPVLKPAARAAPGVVGGLYHLGGRTARRTRRLRRLLWRLTAVVTLGNVMLAVVLVWSRGSADGLLGIEPSLHQGETARVTVAALNLRDGAGLGTSPVMTLGDGDEVNLIGPAETADSQVWWPVSVDNGGGDAVMGYVWQNGIAPVESGRPAWLRKALNRADELGHAVESHLPRLGL